MAEQTFDLVFPGGTLVEDAFASSAERGGGWRDEGTDLGRFAEVVEAVSDRRAVRLGAERGEAVGGPARLEGVAADTVLRVELEDGAVWWTTGAELAAELGQEPRGQVVVEPARSVTRTGAGSRGWGSRLVSLVRTVRRVRVRVAEGASGAEVGAETALDIARALEDRRSHEPGLYRLRAPGRLGERITEPAALSLDAPHLLLLHGTFSSTAGSFGDLGTDLLSRYGDRVLAFEHRSVTESPAANALELVRLLPAGAKLHLVSHSRGGLMGELLCRGGLAGAPLADGEIDAFGGSGHADDRVALAELGRLLAERRPVIERFVRVAAPVRGTLLASDRLDRYLSLALGALGLVLPKESEGFRFLQALTLALVRERADPATLPGLEAMMPTSPLVALLNTGRGPTTADLTVIAGDVEPGWNLLGTLSALATDLFYRQDHDLVVDSRSMFGGAERAPGEARYVFEKSSRTTHFAYFRNPSTAERVRDALAERAGSDVAGFLPLEDTDAPAGVRGIAGEGIVEPDRLDTLRVDRPVVVLLPGIMGSRLRVGTNIVWLDKDDLVGDGFLRLELRDGDRVTPAGPLESSYRHLALHLAGSHEVVPFSYDWRKAIDTEAERLAGVVEGILGRTSQPVRFLAHSMGGLVVRRLRALAPTLWERLRERLGFRFVMLGTPNGGSHAITRIFLGEETIFRLLLFVAPDRAVRQIVGRYPGILDLLPATTQPDRSESLFDLARWQRWASALDGAFAPDGDTLEQARAFRRALDAEPPLTEPGVIYLAGQAEETPVGVSEDDTGRPVLARTAMGDGRVPWATGIPQALRQADRVWYAPGVVHGDLSSNRRLFGALVDLLVRGETSSSAVSRQPPPLASLPGDRGGEAAPAFRVRHPEPLLFPTAAELEAAAMGAEPPSPVPEAPGLEVAVTIAHGSLTFARAPVLVGHYERDVIASAEKVLDRSLDGALTHRHALGLYPGPAGTSELILDTFDPQRGALVLGLGPVGSLSPGTVSRGVRQAVLRYALEVAEIESWDPRDPQGRPLLAVSSLLIGSGTGGGMSIDDSLVAVVQGVIDANTVLGRSPAPTPIVNSLQFVELYEHRAICASEALRDLARMSRLGNERVAVRVESGLDRIEGGQRDIPCGDSGWYRRVQIVQSDRPAEGESEGCDGFRDLEFTTLTDRARAEVRLQGTQRRLVESFVERSVGDTAWRPELSHTLFELLIPQELKDYAPHELDLLLVLDRHAAGYPWELMADDLAEREPPAVRSGMLRQLKVEEFRDRPVTPVADTALVIGDPVTDDPAFPELPGAFREARQVAGQLETGGFDVRAKLQSMPDDVVLALYERPHKVVHVAAHGTFDAACPRTSGVVLADGVRLTATEIRQLRQTPELVFVNCCHLGVRPETGAPPAGAVGRRRAGTPFHRLAANLGVELIQIGVKAVVVAGWAVDDAAATTFAETFYRALLAGDDFGDAVKAARRECYRRHPTHNTWGAYQCYGDPAYRLSDDDRDRGGISLPEWTTPVRVVQRLDNLGSRARTGTASARLAEEIRAIDDRLAEEHPDWLWNGRVREALGRAWAELADLTSWVDPSTPGADSSGPFQKALEHLDAALGCDDQPGTLDLRGDLANIRVRSETVTWRSRWRPLTARLDELPDGAPEGDDLERERASLLSATTGKINQLFEVLRSDIDPWPTPRRLTRLGSASKRLAAMLPGLGRTIMVEAALDAYETANELSRRRCGHDDPYPAFNWALLQTIFHLADGNRSTEGVELLLARLQAADDDSTYWQRLLPVQVGLVRALADVYELRQEEGKKGEALRRAVEPLAESLADETRQASKTMRSHYQLALYLESLDTLIDLTDHRWQPSRAGADRLAAARHLIQRLRDEIARQARAIDR